MYSVQPATSLVAVTTEALQKHCWHYRSGLFECSLFVLNRQIEFSLLGWNGVRHIRLLLDRCRRHISQIRATYISFLSRDKDCRGMHIIEKRYLFLFVTPLSFRARLTTRCLFWKGRFKESILNNIISHSIHYKLPKTKSWRLPPVISIQDR